MSASLEQALRDSLHHYLDTLEAGERVENLHTLIIGECERLLIRQVLEQTANNQSQSARWLGITRNTLKKKMLEYGLCEAPPPKTPPAGKRRRRG